MSEEISRRFIRHYLQDEEKLDISNKMSEAIIKKSSLEADLKTVQSQFRSRIQKTSSEISGLAQKLNSGWEMREVECQVIKDFEEGVVRFQSLETDEIVDERPMSYDERQLTIGEEGDGQEEQEESGGEAEGREAGSEEGENTEEDI